MTADRRPYRWPCSIRACRGHVRTARPKGEWKGWAICQRHWRLVPREIKAARRTAERRWRAFVVLTNLSGSAFRRADRALRCEILCAELRCVREAQLAAAMGLR